MSLNLKDVFEIYDSLSEHNRFEEEIRRMEKKYLNYENSDNDVDRALFCNSRFKVTISFIKERRFSITRKFIKLLIEINEDMENYFRDEDISTNKKYIEMAIQVEGASRIDADYLDKIPLKTHTLNVAKECIRLSKDSPVQTACCNLAIALAHDFGKSPIVRSIYQRQAEEAYSSHTVKKVQNGLDKEVKHHYYSAVYLREKAYDCGLSDLANFFYEVLINHHIDSNSRRDMAFLDSNIIPFIDTLNEADVGARKKENIQERKKEQENIQENKKRQEKSDWR